MATKRTTKTTKARAVRAVQAKPRTVKPTTPAESKTMKQVLGEYADRRLDKKPVLARFCLDYRREDLDGDPSSEALLSICFLATGDVAADLGKKLADVVAEADISLVGADEEPGQ